MPQTDAQYRHLTSESLDDRNRDARLSRGARSWRNHDAAQFGHDLVHPVEVKGVVAIDHDFRTELGKMLIEIERE